MVDTHWPTRSQRAPSEHDFGRWFARLFCVLFALVGAIPLTGGVVLRAEPVQKWAARETARILREELGVSARFNVEFELVPLRLAVTNLMVPSTDGGTPALSTRLAAVSPRLFSLLAGRIDVGDIELEDSAVRLVIQGGEIKNVAYRFPTLSGRRKPLTRAPFRSLAVTAGRVDLTIDNVHVATGDIDIDALAEPNLAFDVSLRMAGATVDTAHATSAPGSSGAHEDVLCALELRSFLSPRDISIKRLSLSGAVDLDAAAGTRPSCSSPGDGRLLLRASQFEVTKLDAQGGQRLPHFAGKLTARVPAGLANRFPLRMPVRGWASFSGTVRYDGTTRLPELRGDVSGERLGMGKYQFAEKFQGDLRVALDAIEVDALEAGYGNGTAWIEKLRVEPFSAKSPIHIGAVRSRGVNFPGLMRDVGVAPNTIVEWDFGELLVSGVSGTLSPFYIDARVLAHTKDFAVYNRAWHDPTKRRMIGVKAATVDGRVRAHTKALEFYETTATFGKSSMPVELVSIGWKSDLVVRLGQGAVLDLEDVSPVVNVPLAGTAKINVDLAGPGKHPVLKGDLAVTGLSIGGFEAGDLTESHLHFEPLRVDITGAQGKKGDMAYALPSARLEFGGPATLEFSALVESSPFVVARFFEIFHFDRDPRFTGISGEGRTKARVRYVLGGPEDTCQSGKLVVEGNTALSRAAVFSESLTGVEGDFRFEWFDMVAGSRGMRLDVPSITLAKGSGTMFGSARLSAGGALRGDFVGSRIPVSRIDMLGSLGKAVDGFVTGNVRVSGNVEALAFEASADVSELRVGSRRLRPSHLDVRLDPAATELRSSGKKSVCGHIVPPEFDPNQYEKDESDGNFHVSGQLFGGQVEVRDVSISSQKNRVVRGSVDLARLDVGAMLAAVGADGLGSPGFGQAGSGQGTTNGHLSGRLDIGSFETSRPFASNLSLELTELELAAGGLRLALSSEAPASTTPAAGKETRRPRLAIAGGKMTASSLALEVTTPGGQRGIVDASGSLHADRKLEADITLRETNLSVLAPALSGVDKADGRLSAHFSARGTWPSPSLRGAIEVHEGKLLLAGLATPVTDLELEVAATEKGLGVSRGTAHWGGGSLTLRGHAPLQGARLGDATLHLEARGVTLPMAKNVRVAFDSDLTLQVPEPGRNTERLPRLSGRVDLGTATYQTPMNVTADITTLTSRGKKSEVKIYDPKDDALEVDVLVTGRKPLVIQNDLMEASLILDPQGLRVTGTNQRLGAVGSVEFPAGGHIHLRNHDFEIQRGLVRFNDPTRLRPEVDLTAATEFRRYGSGSSSSAVANTSTTTTSGAPVSGNWRILLHAYGEPEDLQVDLSSDPPLAQDDIFLLLAVGLTRTELSQSRSTGLGSSVALEALGSLSGAESAVTRAVQIDEFRFGSTYSSRSGRTEPTVTIGKRLSERIRATITTSLSDTNEVRSNVEYRATGNLSVEGSYDNAQSSGSTTVGNVGGDVRWRLEFE